MTEPELDAWQVRYAEWTGLSHRLERFELLMAVFAQNLGRRDRDLNMREDGYARNKIESQSHRGLRCRHGTLARRLYVRYVSL